MPGPLPKAAAQEAHFILRMRERFGIEVRSARYRRLISRIKDDAPGVRLLGYQPPHRSLWRMRFGGRYLVVVYDHSTDRLVTCLFYGARRRQLIAA